MPFASREAVAHELTRLRDGNLDVEIHHRELKTERGPRYEVASRWLEWFKRDGLRECSFKVFAVDQGGFREFPYPGEHGYAEHLLRNTVTSFVAGIQWSLPRTNAILLDIVCDATGNQDFQRALDALPARLRRDMIDRRAKQRRQFIAKKGRAHRTLRLAPLVRVRGNPKLVASQAGLAGTDRIDSELIQLTDLILGVLWDAVQRRTVAAPGRLALARQYEEMTDPSVPLPWRARLPSGRAISVSMYPDEWNRAYTLLPMRTSPGQQVLEFENGVDLYQRRNRPHKEPEADPDFDPEAHDGPAGIGVTELPHGRAVPRIQAESRRRN